MREVATQSREIVREIVSPHEASGAGCGAGSGAGSGAKSGGESSAAGGVAVDGVAGGAGSGAGSGKSGMERSLAEQVHEAITEYAIGRGVLQELFAAESLDWDPTAASKMVNDACGQIAGSVEKRGEVSYSLSRNGTVNEARVTALRRYLLKMVVRRAARVKSG